MSITPRKITIKPNRILTAGGGGIRYEDNVTGQVKTPYMIFAYRKAAGDRRARILSAERNIMGDPAITLYYLDTPKRKIEYLTGNETSLKCFDTVFSESLSDLILGELDKGLPSFTAGQLHTFNSYSFNILTEVEMQLIAATVLEHDVTNSTERFKF